MTEELDDILKTIPEYGNERTIETKELISFIYTNNIKSALDIGANYSWFTYAPHIRKKLVTYDAIDVISDLEISKIVNNYIIGNAATYDLSVYEAILAVSSIEHAGISTYKVEDWQKERYKLIKKICGIANKYIFLTFPYGKPAFVNDQFANITKKQLLRFIEIAKDFKVDVVFYYSSFPSSVLFSQISEEEASNVDFDMKSGVRCICIFMGERKNFERGK